MSKIRVWNGPTILLLNDHWFSTQMNPDFGYSVFRFPLYIYNGWNGLMNGTTSVPKSDPCLILDKVRLLLVIQMFLWSDCSPIRIIHMRYKRVFCNNTKSLANKTT